jgi:hypothetical protein
VSSTVASRGRSEELMLISVKKNLNLGWRRLFFEEGYSSKSKQKLKSGDVLQNS